MVEKAMTSVAFLVLLAVFNAVPFATAKSRQTVGFVPPFFWSSSSSQHLRWTDDDHKTHGTFATFYSRHSGLVAHKQRAVAATSLQNPRSPTKRTPSNEIPNGSIVSMHYYYSSTQGSGRDKNNKNNNDDNNNKEEEEEPLGSADDISVPVTDNNNHKNRDKSYRKSHHHRAVHSLWVLILVGMGSCAMYRCMRNRRFRLSRLTLDPYAAIFNSRNMEYYDNINSHPTGQEINIHDIRHGRHLTEVHMVPLGNTASHQKPMRPRSHLI